MNEIRDQQTWAADAASFLMDPAFSSLVLRTHHHTRDGGLDPGEITQTVGSIIKTVGAGESTAWAEWSRHWLATAHRTHEIALAWDAQPHRQRSAGTAFLRTSDAYRNAIFPLLARPDDPRIREWAAQMEGCFQVALRRLGFAARRVEIPFGDSFLYGCFISPDFSGRPRPTVIVNSGYTVFLEEEFFIGGNDALRSGWNCFLFDGPGQGHTWIRNGLVFQPESEKPLQAVVDLLLQMPEVEPTKIAVFARSFYSSLAIRAVAHESRIAALVLDPGEMSRLRSLLVGRSDAALAAARAGDYSVAAAEFGASILFPGERLGIEMRMAQHGLTDPEEYLRMLARYDHSREVNRLRCPVAVGCADRDPAREQADELFARLTCKVKTFQLFKSIDAAGDHCELGAPGLSQEFYFDWLREVLG